jgi:hypothetical protein
MESNIVLALVIIIILFLLVMRPRRKQQNYCYNSRPRGVYTTVAQIAPLESNDCNSLNDMETQRSLDNPMLKINSIQRKLMGDQVKLRWVPEQSQSEYTSAGMSCEGAVLETTTPEFLLRRSLKNDKIRSKLGTDSKLRFTEYEPAVGY